MSKSVKITLIIISILILITGVAYFVLVQSLEPDIPKPHSDVKVEYKIGWWAYQEALNVKDLNTEILYDRLNLFNSKALVQYTVSGSLMYKKGWRPYIKSAFISERWVSQPENFKGNYADIRVIPIVGVNEDDNYSGEILEFKINIQDYLNSGGWGKNTYKISSQSHEAIIELQQSK